MQLGLKESRLWSSAGGILKWLTVNMLEVRRSIDFSIDGRTYVVLQFFFLIVPSYFSFILVVYLLGEVDAFTPILRIFLLIPYLPFVSLTFSRT